MEKPLEKCYKKYNDIQSMFTFFLMNPDFKFL